MEHFGFTKLVVDDLDRAAAFYGEVFGLLELARVSAEIDGRPIEEIMYRPTATGASTFVLLSFPGQPAASPAGVIPGFITADIEALIERATAAGGKVVEAPTHRPDHNVTVGFVADPEGRLIEIVQLA